MADSIHAPHRFGCSTSGNSTMIVWKGLIHKIDQMKTLCAHEESMQAISLRGRSASSLHMQLREHASSDGPMPSVETAHLDPIQCDAMTTQILSNRAFLERTLVDGDESRDHVYQYFLPRLCPSQGFAYGMQTDSVPQLYKSRIYVKRLHSSSVLHHVHIPCHAYYTDLLDSTTTPTLHALRPATTYPSESTNHN